MIRKTIAFYRNFFKEVCSCTLYTDTETDVKALLTSWGHTGIRIFEDSLIEHSCMHSHQCNRYEIEAFNRMKNND